LVFSTQPARETAGLASQNLDDVSTPFPLFVMLVSIAFGLYSFFVTLRLTMDNYSIGLKAAVRLIFFSTLLLSAVAIVFVALFIVGGGSGT
jgi:hypothetical protein